ncbi:hypothetical protein GCM10020000_71250 [Streptomyces olivoverticillatus]
MLWIDSVFSLTYQAVRTPARAAQNITVETVYGTPATTWKTSAAMVPNTLTMTIADQ